MSSASVSPSAVKAYVQERAQDGLRGVAVYRGDVLDVTYVRGDLGDDLRERFADLHASVLAACDDVSETDEQWGTLGLERASIQIRDGAAMMHLKPSASADVRSGVFVELETHVARSCAEFVADVRRVAFSE
ncbi:hypothetical protein [Halobacterium litoreum]|uniref:Roadblock/LC7 domain-containing protein n=1 Tax=Halobacterium litoreum TaxID=2039234 RepID=A0ABD5NFJ6_9EURY|nr:hypothetical protein [Halobacterium litoreum]UHH13420.1 hypothetical protein LT972_00130 [Halobacterium litoreum]